MVGVRQFDEKAMLEKALEIFWQQGPAATTMPDLAEATAVQRGSLYNAYGDKERIFLEAFEIYADRYLEAVRVSLDGRTASEILDRFFCASIENVTTGHPSRGCLTTKTASDGTLMKPSVRRRVQRLIADVEEMVANALSNFEGEMTTSPRAAASLIMTFTRGLAVMERINGDPEQLKATASLFIKAIAPLSSKRASIKKPAVVSKSA